MTAENDDKGRKVTTELNERFFARAPGHHFRTRAQSLMLLADNRTDLAPNHNEKSMTRQVHNRLPGWSISDSKEIVLGERDLEEFLTVECFMLKHHIGESLLRHFLALLDSNRTIPPWLAMSHLQNPKKFRKRIERFMAASYASLQPAIEWAFLPEREAAECTLGARVIADYEQHATRWLRHFGQFHIDTAYGYNAAKHGLGSVPSRATVLFTEDDPANGQPPHGTVLLDGSTLETLEFTTDSSGDLIWSQVTRTVDVPGTLAEVLVGADVFDNLWRVAKARHLGGGAELRFTDGPTPEAISSRGGRSGGTFRVQVAITQVIESSHQR